jgi:heavy metal-binding protein
MNIFNKFLMIVFAFALGAVLISACGSQEKDDDAADTEGQEMMENGDHEGHDHDAHEGHDHDGHDHDGHDNGEEGHDDADVDHASATHYCPMKCEGETTYDKAGSCPVCGMDLVVLEEQEENL